MTRDDGLPGAVEIDRLDHLALVDLFCRFDTGSEHFLVVEIENGGHRAFTRRHRFLHRRRPQADKRHGVLEFENASGNQCRIFAQTMPGDDRRQFAPFFQPKTVSRNRRREHQRLRVDRLRQQIGGALGGQLPEILIKRRRGFVKGRANDRRIAVGRHHAHRL